MTVEESTFVDKGSFFDGARMILCDFITLFQLVLHMQQTKQLFQLVCTTIKISPVTTPSVYANQRTFF